MAAILTCAGARQMVLDCVGRESPLLSQGTVYDFRIRCIHQIYAVK